MQVYCEHCFTTHPDTRAKRSEATRRTLRRPDAKRNRLARWGKFGNAYFDRAMEEFERLRRGGAPKKAELHGRWLAMFRGSDAELEEMLEAAPVVVPPGAGCEPVVVAGALHELRRPLERTNATASRLNCGSYGGTY